MGTIASQITSLTIVYSSVYSGADQRKHQSSASLAFVRWIHRGPVNSPHKWPVTRKMFPFDDVIMKSFDSSDLGHFSPFPLPSCTQYMYYSALGRDATYLDSVISNWCHVDVHWYLDSYRISCAPFLLARRYYHNHLKSIIYGAYFTSFFNDIHCNVHISELLRNESRNTANRVAVPKFNFGSWFWPRMPYVLRQKRKLSIKLERKSNNQIVEANISSIDKCTAFLKLIVWPIDAIWRHKTCSVM